jgi:mono/diheme cytochrome c family protein
MWLRSILLALLAVIAVLVLGLAGLSWRPAIAFITLPEKTAFDETLIGKGRALALIGNCNDCHTRPGGVPYAGGRALSTPFGTIHSTNITPEPDAGIGRWSEDAFRRAMHEGVSRDGHHLYPAFPYDHFTKLTDDDVRALYAFLMTRAPVRAEIPPNDISFPFNLRPLIAGWKLLFFEPGRFQTVAGQDPQWTRGAYLVDALAHCGACHTPRNILGAERRSKFLAGGEAEGWHAPALDRSSTAPVAWTQDQLFIYLRRGFVEPHGVAAGSDAAGCG